MSKKIIAVNAGPRKGWNTDTLISEAVKGAESAGAEVVSDVVSSFVSDVVAEVSSVEGAVSSEALSGEDEYEVVPVGGSMIFCSSVLSKAAEDEPDTSVSFVFFPTHPVAKALFIIMVSTIPAAIRFLFIFLPLPLRGTVHIPLTFMTYYTRRAHRLGDRILTFRLNSQDKNAAAHSILKKK